jgi:hypothetical protein
MNSNEELKKLKLQFYLELEEDSLYIEIGRASHADEGVQFGPETAIREGRRWFELHKAKLRDKICREWDYCSKRKQKRWQDTGALGVAIADLIVAATGGVPPLAVTALLIRIGLDEFCGCGR